MWVGNQSACQKFWDSCSPRPEVVFLTEPVSLRLVGSAFMGPAALCLWLVILLVVVLVDEHAPVVIKMGERSRRF